MQRFYYLFANLDLNSIPGTRADSAHLQTIINTVLAITGAIAVLIVVLAGIRLIFSQGDSGQIATARNAIIYSLVGLIVIMFVFAIVNFVVLRVG
jgi:hypothetical protein